MNSSFLRFSSITKKIWMAFLGLFLMIFLVVQEISDGAQEILKKYPNANFFGGQLVFPEEIVFTRWLHNYTVFAIQRRFYYQGIPIILLPIRL